MPHLFTKDLTEIETYSFELLDNHTDYCPDERPGISKYSADLGNGTSLDALLVNQESDTLLISCHGALDRRKISLPRFERLRSFLRTPYSSLYFADPALQLSEKLTLSWYTGWLDLDLHEVMAEWAIKTAKTIGATKLVFIGSSGGGFASLQVSSLIPGSLAIPMNPQTAIHRYRPQSGSVEHQRNYIRHVMPHLIPAKGFKMMDWESDWSTSLGSRASVVRQYAQPISNHVFFAQNFNDVTHIENHYRPFKETIDANGNKDRVRFHFYDGPETHDVPNARQLREILQYSLEWFERVRQEK